MKRMISVLLLVGLCFGLCACGETAASVERYTPAKTISATFGEVTIVDAAFCAKAQAYITESTYSSEITVNGQTTSSSTQTIVTPGYTYADAGGILFALKTRIKNNSDSEIAIAQIPALVQFSAGEPLYLQKSVNFSVTDVGGETLAAGSTAEVIFAARISVEEYRTSDSCILDVDGSKLKFDYDSIHVFQSLGYEETDGIPITMERLMQSLGNEMPAGENNPPEALVGRCNNSTEAVGNAVTISDVSVSFLDKLPEKLYSEYSRIGNGDEHILDESQVYAAVHFCLTNNTKQEQLLANMNDDFVVDVNYQDGFLYSTDHETACYYETRAEMTRASGRSRLGKPIAVQPLATAEITIHIPCASVVSTDDAGSLIVTFHSRFGGYESFDFVLR